MLSVLFPLVLSRRLLVVFLAVLIGAIANSVAAVRWETHYSLARSKAKEERRPMCVVCVKEQVGVPPDLSGRFDAELEGFTCVWVRSLPPLLQQKVNEEGGRKYRGYRRYLFIDPESEELLIPETPDTLSFPIVTKARAAGALPLTPEMRKQLESNWAPDARRLHDMTMAGDVEGLAAYLKPLDANPWREHSYLILRVKLPPAVRPDHVIIEFGKRLTGLLRPSGVALLRVSKPQGGGTWTRKEVTLRVQAVGCTEVVEKLEFDAQGTTIREVELTRIQDPASAVFTGIVTLHGKPMPGAEVRVGEHCTATDANGRFAFYQIREGFIQTVSAVAPGGGLQETIRLPASGRLQNRELVLLPGDTATIREAEQTDPTSKVLVGPGVRIREVMYVRIAADGARSRGRWFGDHEIGRLPAAGAATLTWRNGGRRVSTRFTDIENADSGEPGEEKSDSLRTRDLPIRVGDVFITRKTGFPGTFAKIEVLEITPAGTSPTR